MAGNSGANEPERWIHQDTGDPGGRRVLTVSSKIRKNTRRPEPPEMAAIVPTYRCCGEAPAGYSPAPGNEPGSGCGCDDPG